MVAQRSEYVARRTIEVNGVRAYNEGDPVPAGAVENLGLVVGEDVDPSDLRLLPKPPSGARRAEWVAYARSQGVSQDEVDGMTVKDIEAHFAEPEPAAEPQTEELAED